MTYLINATTKEIILRSENKKEVIAYLEALSGHITHNRLIAVTLDNEEAFA